MKTFLANLFRAPLVSAEAPAANRFRVGDCWRGTNGLTYLVKPGPTHGLVLLEPVRPKGEKPFRIHAGEVNGLTRVRWGGRP